jgi:3-hydroxy-9,10-secoandrosta-1,3,5(10)-triene-9,17-dione monooxygenase reductase component
MGTEFTESAAFREALARFASGVTIVTAGGETGPVGFTATGFTSVSLLPPLILVCVGKLASAHDGVVGAERFGVSILSEHQTAIAEQFARSGIDRFQNVPLRGGRVPLIEGAVASLECRRYAHHDAGDHTLLLGEVLETWVQTGRPLLHYLRRFGGFAVEGALRSRTALESARKGSEA